MKVSDVQILLTASGYYNGGIDGVIGDKTLVAVSKILTRNLVNAETWSTKRRLIAAAQLVLNATGNEAGEVDGYAGHNTEEALAAWYFQNQHAKREAVKRTPLPTKSTPKGIFPHQNQCPTFYGTPGSDIASQLVAFRPAYDMRLDWKLGSKVRTIRLHKKCVSSADKAINRIKITYGQDRLRQLGLDRYAGAYNHRKMRGGTSWSMHAYACAIDFYARPNGLRMRCPQALFCKPEYSDFFDIWEEFGWTSLGRAIGRDWMHVQAADL